MRSESAENRAPRPGRGPRPDAGRLLVLFAAYGAVALAVLAPAMEGPFLSDDVPYIVENPAVHALSADNLAAILDPTGSPAYLTFNYAPLHLLAHAVEWRVFGDDATGYHVVNALLHAAVATLLAALLLARGLGWPAAAGLGGLFLVHPANVETAAWISQLKTLGAAALALGALLAHPRRPAAGAGLFGASLLFKASAAAALAPALVWSAADPAWRARRRWIAAWIALLAVWAPFQVHVYARASGADAPLHPDAWVNARTIVAIAGRYLAMAATSWGTSALHDPPRALAWTDPWWLAGAAALALLGARALLSLRAGREEAAWWAFAAAGWAPISQVVPFLVPMADHYLYFVLPGLLGGATFALRDALPAPLRSDRRAALAACSAALAVAAGFAARSHERARIWRSPAALALDSAAHYPEGMPAHLLRANRAARAGDAPSAVAELRGALARGYDRFLELDRADSFAWMRQTPAFRAVVRDAAGAWLEVSESLPDPTPTELRMRAEAYLVRDEPARAAAALERAAELSEEPDRTALEHRAAALRRSAGTTDAASPPR